MEKLQLANGISGYIYGDAVALEIPSINSRFFQSYTEMLNDERLLQLDNSDKIIAGLKEVYEKYTAKNEPTDELFIEYENQLQKGVVAMATSNQTVITDLWNCGTLGAKQLLAKNPHITDELFIELTKIDNSRLHQNLATNPKLTSDHLKLALFGDGKFIGSRFIAVRPDLSQDIVNQIADKVAFNFWEVFIYDKSATKRFFEIHQVNEDILEKILTSSQTNKVSFLTICKYQKLNEQLLINLINENRYNCRKVIATRSDLTENVVNALLSNNYVIKERVCKTQRFALPC